MPNAGDCPVLHRGRPAGFLHRGPAVGHGSALRGPILRLVRIFEWSPRCERPTGLVVPLRVGAGVTRGQARGKAWRTPAPGYRVPVTAPDVVEQRVLEQSVRLNRFGAVTGWAALRWHGAAYFDGTARGGRELLPVPLLVAGGSPRPSPDYAPSWEQLAPSERCCVDGLWVTTVQRALFDEMRRSSSLRDAVVAADMAAAAGLISIALMSGYVEHRAAWAGVPLVRRALALATDDSWSPRESRLRLAWTLDAELPVPLCNAPVFSLDGRLLGVSDLLDPATGLVGEYDGADHLREDRRARDLDRESVFRDHGLEVVTFVAGQLHDRDASVRRLHAGQQRARSRPTAARRWTLQHPAWYRPTEALHARLVREGRADDLTHA